MNSELTENAFASIDEILCDLKAGKMVIMVDDEGRENEGDLMIAAEKVTADDVNFMITEGRGLLCLTVTRERARKLNLALMVESTDASHDTNFLISIDAAEGLDSGASTRDRARTLRLAAAENAQAEFFKQPGHVFPILAQDGGVLERAGHTEASCDLMRMAGFEPAAAITEVLNVDGSMARRPDLEVFAAKHGLKIGTIAELIEYRRHSDHNVERSIIGA